MSTLLIAANIKCSHLAKRVCAPNILEQSTRFASGGVQNGKIRGSLCVSWHFKIPAARHKGTRFKFHSPACGRCFSQNMRPKMLVAINSLKKANKNTNKMQLILIFITKLLSAYLNLILAKLSEKMYVFFLTEVQKLRKAWPCMPRVAMQ